MAEHPALAIFRVWKYCLVKKFATSYAQNTIERSGHGKDSLHKIMVINQNAANAMERMITSESVPESMREVIYKTRHNHPLTETTTLPNNPDSMEGIAMWEIVYTHLHS